MIQWGIHLQTVSRKFIIALVATLIFSFIFSLIGYTDAAKQYFSFPTMILTFVTLSAPMFLVVGVICSFVFEKFLRSEWMKLISYIVMGAVLILPYALYVFQDVDSLRFSIIGAIGAALFYGVQKGFNRFVFKI